MEWDKFSEKAMEKLLPIFLIVRSIQLIFKDLRQKRNDSKVKT